MLLFVVLSGKARGPDCATDSASDRDRIGHRFHKRIHFRSEGDSWGAGAAHRLRTPPAQLVSATSSIVLLRIHTASTSDIVCDFS